MPSKSSKAAAAPTVRPKERRAILAAELTAHGYEFTSCPSGKHLQIAAAVGTVDFWPGHGHWYSRATCHSGTGLASLLTELRLCTSGQTFQKGAKP